MRNPGSMVLRSAALCLLAWTLVVGATTPPSRTQPATTAATRPSAAQEREVAGLIKQLEDDDFQVREEVTMKLRALGPQWYTFLHQAKQRTDDPEVQERLHAALAGLWFWHGKETVAQYAGRMGIRETERTVDLTSASSVEPGGKVTLKLTLIPAGEFLMGSSIDEAGRGGDETRHKVKLTRPFLMGVTEVTQGQWKAVMGTTPSHFKGSDDLPVEQVSWDDATAFCAALSRKEGRKYRLPTEAEWEHACRAGSTTPFQTRETISTDEANYHGNFTYGTGSKGVSREKPVVVGSFKPNGWGLHDMHGNVWEWCADWYGDYPKTGVTNPTGPGTGTSRVKRGGSWSDEPAHCRSACRSGYPPHYRYGQTGFRVVLDLSE